MAPTLVQKIDNKKKSLKLWNTVYRRCFQLFGDRFISKRITWRERRGQSGGRLHHVSTPPRTAVLRCYARPGACACQGTRAWQGDGVWRVPSTQGVPLPGPSKALRACVQARGHMLCSYLPGTLAHCLLCRNVLPTRAHAHAHTHAPGQGGRRPLLDRGGGSRGPAVGSMWRLRDPNAAPRRQQHGVPAEVCRALRALLSLRSGMSWSARLKR